MKTNLFSKVFWTQASAAIIITSMLLVALPIQTASAASIDLTDGIVSCTSDIIRGSPALTPAISLTLTQLSPDWAAEGGPSFTLTVTGTGFFPGSFVLWEKGNIYHDLSTTFISDTELTAEVPAELISQAHEVPFVYVCNAFLYDKANTEQDPYNPVMSNGLPFFLTKTGAAVTGFDVGIGVDPSASFAGVSADGIGDGILIVAQYATNPAPGMLLFGLGNMYYDVHIGPDSDFTQVTIQFCGESALMGMVFFWNGFEWVQPSDQSIGPVGCVTVVVTDATVPSLADLTGGLFGTIPSGVIGDEGRHHFADVPPTYWAWPWISILADAGITNGCSTLPYFCPDDPVTRAQMAIFLERGINGATYNPPAGTGAVFADVPLSYSADNWIENLYADGITGGCLASPLSYCPDNSVTRAQMAIFLLRAKHGAAYTPPAVGASTGFNDVSTSYWAAAWIKQLAAEGITGGCGGGNYCSENSVTRAEMAKFLVITFNLP